MHCKNCGKKILNNNSNFCTSCGEKLISVIETKENVEPLVTNDFKKEKKKIIAFVVGLLSVCLVIAIIYFVTYQTDMSSTQKTIDINSMCDYVLASGGGYNLVVKRVDDPVSPYDTVGVIDDEGNWVEMPRKFHIFIDENYQLVGKPGYGTQQEQYENCLAEYAGEGIFVIRTGVYPNNTNHFVGYNVIENIGFDIGRCAHDKGLTFSNGYCITKEGNRSGDLTKIISSTGKIITLDIPSDGISGQGKYSEGMFFSHDGFYDLDGNKLISLSKYKGLIVNQPYFSNGQCRITVQNSDGKRFYGTIDTSGSFIEPLTLR